MKLKQTIIAASLTGGALLAVTLVRPSLVAFDPIAFDPVAFDPVAFDPVAFDPLFASGAACMPAQGGPPLLLARLIQAQGETAPFRSAQQGPIQINAALPPLFADLGKLHVPVSTANPRAQAYFDQGMRLTFAFNHAEAAQAFRAAQRLDPACATCYWGEALVLGPNINAPMFPTAVAPAAARSPPRPRRA